MRPPKVRAFYRATQVAGKPPPYDNLSLKIYYPCHYGDSFEERNSGFIPADTSHSPFPVVIIMPGINVSHEAYGWLAHTLAETGFVVVSYSWIAQEMQDLVSISPGFEIEQLMHKNYGKAVSCPALPALLAELGRVNSSSLLAGLLDLDSIVLGGHSAGGTMALLNARQEWVPGLRGVFSYAAHTAANSQLGWDADSVMPINPNLPTLIMGGTRDGVIAASSHRYGDAQDSEPSARVERTFHEAIGGNRGDRHLVIVEGANHFSFVYPRDDATGRPFLDWKAQGNQRSVRNYLGRLTAAFCESSCSSNTVATLVLGKLCNNLHPLAAVAASK